MAKTRRQIAREKATVCIYQNLLVECTFEEMLPYLQEFKALKESEEAMEFCCWLIHTVIENKDSYIKVISKHLRKDWSFERLGKIEQAILLIATCELLETEVPKKVIINEAVINSKQFCDEDSYKFINGILGKII